MRAGRASRHVVAEKTAWVRKMFESIRALPLLDRTAFFADPRNVASADSYLRRCLEALMDLGRHLAAKVFASPVRGYKDIP